MLAFVTRGEKCVRGRSSAWWFVVIGVIFIVVAAVAFLLWP